MFTGIIAAVGRVAESQPTAAGARLRIAAGGLDLADVALGDSIAVNGVCLTVVNFSANSFDVDASPETLACTAGFGVGAAVNLEKALRLADRLGGHLVSGHVDGVGTVVRFDPVGENRLLAVELPDALSRYVAHKGSITLNGVSLTVNAVSGTRFEVNLIPHTLQATNLHALAAGERINVEVDLLARYVERMLNPSV